MPSIHFKGKSSVETFHLTVPYRRLVAVPELSRTEQISLDDNLIVQGDNLLALKALLPTFTGKVKCIYIDPPYNTGNEGWVYNDNVSSPMHTAWLHEVVSRDDLTRHDKWLCMIWPRLKLLRELLRDDGAIFISIDDNEAHRLRMAMDEIFGEENFVAQFVWRKVDSPNDNKVSITPDHEFILCYTKTENGAAFKPLIADSILDAYGNIDDKGRYYRDRLLKKNGKNSLRKDRPTMFFSIIDPDGNEVYPIHDNGEEARWAAGRATVEEHLSAGTLIWKKREKRGVLVWEPYTREYAPEEPTRPYPTIWTDLPTMRQAKAMLRTIFATSDLFSTPKPIELIQRIVEFCTDPDSIILDSFAGSGTTAQAVLAQNAEDGGNRRFILVEQEDYADTLTAERVRRVIEGVPDAKEEALRNGYGGSFGFFRLGDPLDDEAMLRGENLPSYSDLARYVFFTATGEQLDETQVDEGRFYLGESRLYEVYMIYKPDPDFLRNIPLNLSWAQGLGPAGAKPRLVVASHKYLDAHRLQAMKIEYCQLPFAIYRFSK